MTAAATPHMHAPAPQPAQSPGASVPPAKGFFARLFRDPNAIWLREMRQGSRLGRTPWILFALTLTISLLMCSIGGLAASENATPASLGGGLFQTFFSIAYLVVVIVGPAVAANSVASEREGKTWEAILLTGLQPKEIARGKFMAAYTTIALYIVVLAPVGALSFLFGGVTATEVVVAFAFLFLLAALGVAFGLGVSSLMSSLRGAIVVTLIMAICIGPLLYSVFGFGMSFAIHKEWNEVPEAFPIWLPLAYSRAKFGMEYVVLLFALPILLVVVPAWFLYESTVANLTGDTDDRSTGLKVWFTICTPLLAAACAVPGLIAEDDGSRMGWSVAGMCAFATHLGFAAMLFAFEPPGASRRVRIHWERTRIGALRRFFGPGLAKSSVLVMVLGVLGLAGIAFLDMAVLQTFGTSAQKETQVLRIFFFAAYATPFFVFVVGLVAWLRARGNSPWIARLITGGVLFLIAAGPWVVAAIGGVLAHSNEREWIVIAAPSPFYAFAMIVALDPYGTSTTALVIPVGLACAAAWGALGLALLTAAARRCAQQVASFDAAVAQADAALHEEERAAARGAAEAAARTGIEAHHEAPATIPNPTPPMVG
jgi:ABC-type transport system involved in multi-copper enzyme maturation permease subunit